MATHEIVALAAGSMAGASIANCSLDRHVAIGVTKGGPDNTDAWAVLSFVNGEAQLIEVRYCETLEDPDSELNVAIVISAKAEIWSEIGQGGFDAAIAAADSRKISISGKLAYFIRHVRSTVDVIVLFGRQFASNDQ